jgi:uncharacterized protein (DUF302 family)
MEYHFTKIVSGTFEKVTNDVIDKLKEHGFGIISEINIQEIFKNKLGKEIGKYWILGACNPNYGYRAYLEDDKFGTIIPCNVAVIEKDNGFVQVSSINPYVAMKIMDNPRIEKVAIEVGEILQKVVEGL